MFKQKVFVGLSGGVDSAVSAALLKKSGYEVVGVFIRTWHPDFIECNEEEERRDAMRVAAYLNIPFLTFDFEDVYKNEVADYMISEYKAGRTPNPDVMCNKEVKFGAFLKKSISMGADYVATGHYARILKIQSENSFSSGPRISGFLSRPDHSEKLFQPSLAKGKDLSKDQSYFLWTLKEDQLSKIIFPIGHLEKSEVRKLAHKFNLPVAEKKDSQGICFLGAIDLKDFLKHYITEKKGKVLSESGEEIGYHNGAVFLTLGERHGFTITKKTPTDNPYYVVAKDVKSNTVTVSQQKNIQKKSPESFSIKIQNTNWIIFPEKNKKYTAQIRYHGELLSCEIEDTKDDYAEVVFSSNVIVAPGQSLVIYDKDVCLGGGVVV